jgi:predicted MPP superfamily phosphohydrolase
MFGTVLIATITLLHVYVFWRAAGVKFLQRFLPRKHMVGLGILLWALFFAGRVYGHSGTTDLARILEFVGMNWMAALFLIFVSLLAVDCVTGFGFLLPRFAPQLRGAALGAGVMLSAIALDQGMRAPVIVNYAVAINGLPVAGRETVIVAMSDLHIGSLLDKKWLEERIIQVQREKPDLVVLLGDLFEGHGQPQDELLPILRRLSAPLGVWVVKGNHENHSHNDSSPLLKEAGFHLLRNRWAEVRPGLILAGVDDLNSRRRSGQESDLIARTLADRPPGATILLSHTPWQYERAARAGVDLMLSGHTHGGQIWPFDYLVKRYYPLLEGRYEVDKMTVLVCRGTGTWGPRMRLWRPGEILRITLHARG